MVMTAPYPEEQGRLGAWLVAFGSRLGSRGRSHRMPTGLRIGSRQLQLEVRSR
jgi:hypothetical protein